MRVHADASARTPVLVVNDAAPSRTDRVIVADDDADHRAWLALHLRLDGFNVCEMVDGYEVLDLLFAVQPGHFAAVVCDEHVSGLRGSDCLAIAPSLSRFVIVTNVRDVSADMKAARLGAAAVLHKPFDPRAITAVIRRIMQEDRRTGVIPTPPITSGETEIDRATSTTLRSRSTRPPSLVERIHQTSDDLDMVAPLHVEPSASPRRPSGTETWPAPEDGGRSEIHPKQRDVGDGSDETESATAGRGGRR
jgi:CheY-like chemotaxis protein